MQEMFKNTPWEDKGLVGFHGDLSWIRRWEGHMGHPYWPGGASGLTLDPGVDLGYIDLDLFQELYIDVLSLEEVEMLSSHHGVRGKMAKEVAELPEVKAVRVSKEDALNIFPFIAAPYWEKISARFPALRRAPGLVHTAFLSLSINRGPHNADLSVLKKPLIRQDWEALAGVLEDMQNDHMLHGIRRRRDEEGELVQKAATLRQKKYEKLAECFRGVPSAPPQEYDVDFIDIPTQLPFS